MLGGWGQYVQMVLLVSVKLMMTWRYRNLAPVLILGTGNQGTYRTTLGVLPMGFRALSNRFPLDLVSLEASKSKWYCLGAVGMIV